MLKLNKLELFDQGFSVIRNAFDKEEISLLGRAYESLINRGSKILHSTYEKGQTLSEYYQDTQDLIVVPEKDDRLKVCRFEYIYYSSKEIVHHFVNPITNWISEITGEPFVLFKDKCNVKSPGGGGYGAHQDFTAYHHFKPRYHITAALLLDDSNTDNGCLHMALDYKKSLKKGFKWIRSQFGLMPLIDNYKSGEKNGDIVDEIADRFNWVPIEGNAGDVILFDSFIPHKSYANASKNMRRNFFFTYNAKSEGSHYNAYYKEKCKDFTNPKFHVSTPTVHSTAV